MRAETQKEEAFHYAESLVMEYQARLRAFVFSRVHDRNVTDDLVQEVFLVVVRRIEEFDRTRAAWPWLVGIAKNKLFEYWRQKKQEVASDTLESAIIEFQMEQETARPAQEMQENRLDALGHCLAELDGPARDLIRMSYEDRIRSEQLAVLLKRKASGVRVTLCRLRELLLHCVERRMTFGAT